MAGNERLAKLEQKFDDIKAMLSAIDTKVSSITSSVTGAMLKINTVETQQTNCPAREHYFSDKKDGAKSRRDWTSTIIAACAVLVSIWAVVHG